MADAFDPYHQWLGIPAEEQPPNHYRLLGIKTFEDDPNVIEHAADRQMAHLRTFQGGKHGAMSQALLNEVAAAKVHLLDPQKKAEYDQRLRAELESHGPQGVEMIDPDLARLIGDAAGPARAGTGPRQARQASRWFAPAAVGAAVLVGLVVAGVAFYSNRGPEVAENAANREAGLKSSTRQGVTESRATGPTQETKGLAARPEASDGTGRSDSTPASTPAGDESGKSAAAPATPSPGPAGNQPKAAAEGPPKTAEEASATKVETAAKEPSPAEAKPERLPLPDADTQQKIAAQMEEIYKLSERTTPEAKLAAAKELAKAADSAEEKPDERFVLLRRVAELAVDGGDAALMLQALDLLAGQFSLDGLAAKEKMLARLGQTARSEAAIQSFVTASTTVIEQAVAAERYETAASVAKLAQQVCGQRSAGRPFRKQAAEQRRQVESLVQQRQAVTEAEATLKQKPDDPEANLALGRWFACGVGDWARALPHLAKGSDQLAKQLAQQELAAVAGKPEDQVNLADAWYDAAKARDGEERDAFLRHAGTWYQEAQRQVPGGLLRTKIDKRLEEIATLGPGIAAGAGSQAEAGKPIARGRWVDLLAQVDLERDALFGPVFGQTYGEWQRAGREVRGGPWACFFLPVTVEGDYDLECEFTRTAGNDFVMFRLPVGPRVVDLFLSADLGAGHGLGKLDGRDWNNNPTTLHPGKLENGRPYRVQVRVRCEGENAAIDAALNGTGLVHWSGKTKSLSPNNNLLFERTQPALEVGVATKVTCHAARFRLVTGSASLLPPRFVFMGSKLLMAYLNDIRHWRVRQGEWRVEDGRFLGSGDSFQGLLFQHKLPANFVLEFKMSVLDSMRPRCYFRDVRIGNESSAKTIFLFDSAQGTPFPYEYRQTMQIRMVFQGLDVRLEIDGKPVAQTKRKAVLDEFLWIGGGDRTSPGTTAFWDFKLNPTPPPTAGSGAAGGDRSILLSAEKAQIHGKTGALRYHAGVSALVNWNNPDEWVSWEFTPESGQAYEIEVNYRCAKYSEGSVCAIGFFSAKGRQLASVQQTVAGTGPTWNESRVVSLGKVKFPQRSPVTGVVKPLSKPGEAVMDLKWVRLTPVAAKP